MEYVVCIVSIQKLFTKEREREKERHTERDRQREMYYNKPTTFFNFALDRHNFVFMFDSF